MVTIGLSLPSAVTWPRRRAATSPPNRVNPMVTILRDTQRVVEVYSRLLRLKPRYRTPSPVKVKEPESLSSEKEWRSRVRTGR